MKKIMLFLLVLSATTSIVSENYESVFRDYFELKDTLKMRKTLQKWEIDKPEDAELFTSYLDYYYLVAHNELSKIHAVKTETEHKQQPTDTPRVVAYSDNDLKVIRPIIFRGITKIDQGIQLYPDRLDMRLGEIFVLGDAQDWTLFTKKIIETIDYSAVIKNEWKWTHNETKEDGEETLFSSLQDYQEQLHNTIEYGLLSNMKDIALEVLKFYPNHLQSMSNLSIVYMTYEEVDKAIEILQRAERIEKKDYVILSSLAYAYKHKGDKAKAIEYYQKAARYGDAEASQKAKEQIKELKKELSKPTP